MSVEINITKKVYEFIDPATGEKIKAEDFAKKYPAVGIARLPMGDGQETTGENGGDK